MKFQRLHNIEFTDTTRKRAAYLLKIKREREQYPLLDLVGELEFEDVDVVMDKRRLAWDIDTINERKVRAEEWIKARRLMREHPKHKEIYHYWNVLWLSNHTPIYLLDMIRNFDSIQKTRAEYEAKKAIWSKSRTNATFQVTPEVNH